MKVLMNMSVLGMSHVEKKRKKIDETPHGHQIIEFAFRELILQVDFNVLLRII